MTSPIPPGTYTISGLAEEVRGFLGEAFSSVWVAGEVQRPRSSQKGHLYLELVEKGRRDEIVGKLDAVLWRTDHQRVRRMLASSGQEIADGQLIRCWGSVDFYPPSGRLQFVVRDVDPLFTLGLLAQRRRETLEALVARQLLERNRRHPLPPLPLRLGLISSAGSAAYHDFLTTLKESGFGFGIVFVHAAVQGREAERDVAVALRRLGGTDIDVCALVRGGGSRTDLAVFDSRTVAEAIARAPFPVLTGLGHEIDESIADLVAHTALKTPTKVAEFLVERVGRAEATLLELRAALVRQASSPLRDACERLERAERGLQLARLRLAGASNRVRELGRALSLIARRRLLEAEQRRAGLGGRLAVAAPRQAERRRREPLLLVQRLVDLSRLSLRESTATLNTLSRLCRELSPQRTLGRGFSLTRHADGRILRRSVDVVVGDRITTQLADGHLRSRVEEA